MAVIDVVTYNGEKELFEIRYNILKDFVDQFIVVEFDKTFSGQPKPWRFVEDFKGYKFKNVCYHGMEEEEYVKYRNLAESSSNTKGAEHWKMEFMQKECVGDTLQSHHLKDEDIVFIGDCDEIWEPPKEVGNGIVKLKLRVYAYYLNNRSNEIFWGTIMGKYKNMIGKCFNHLRSTDYYRATEPECGWHFTSMHHQLEKKLKDSYTEETYATVQVLDDLQENIKNNKDFLGREFTYRVDESEWPQYLKDNREKYLHLLK